MCADPGDNYSSQHAAPANWAAAARSTVYRTRVLILYLISQRDEDDQNDDTKTSPLDKRTDSQ